MAHERSQLFVTERKAPEFMSRPGESNATQSGIRQFQEGDLMRNTKYGLEQTGVRNSGRLTLTLGYLLTFMMLGAAGSVHADEGSIRAWAATCAPCHGTQGVSASTVPTLAGRPAEELNRLLLEFKTDQRKGSVMNQHAKGYSEAEIKQLADYFAAQRP